jgi:hypothetical protein
MTQKSLNKLKHDLDKMNRSQLIDTIYELSSDEMTEIHQILEIAKETQTQLKNRLSFILNYFEYLAK